MEALAAQEARLDAVRAGLRGRFERDYGAGERNPVELLARLARLQERCKALQGKVETLANAKQELVDALYAQNCKPPKAGDVERQGKEGNLVTDQLEFLVRSDEANDAFAAALDSQGAVNALLETSEGRRAYFVAPATEAQVEDNVILSRTALQVAIEASGAAIESDSDDAGSRAGSPRREGAEADKENQQRQQGVKPAGALGTTVESFAFEALPESIRGRAKLHEVNQALQIIVGYFAKSKRKAHPPGKPAVVSIKALDALGAKVVGHTGACVIHCLRSLGFIQVTREGVSLTSN
ncbi:SKA2 domain-containing protein [Durusdinium trenchii]|uniref:SKA2 domain-containing protein n=1 Tax=Durusdinium trenchii TaxID=1381693 RepID=A0ABP0S420_9DINO